MRLPREIDEFIFDQLQATYRRDPGKVKKTLCFDEKSIKEYLGTYFPRSFVESYTIFDELFNHPIINEIFLKKSRINILDIGSGTGGELMGILWLFKREFRNKKIYIVSVDGSKLALDYQKLIINEFKTILHNKVMLKQDELRYESKTDFNNSIDDYLGELAISFDIIITSKFINEMCQNDDYELNKDLYRIFINATSKYLNDDGLLALVDITEKLVDNDVETYIPKIMNSEINPYIQSMPSQIRLILPLSCAFWYQKCRDFKNCFQRRIFNVSHSRKDDESGIVYKLFMKEEIANKILDTIGESNCYRLEPQKYCHMGDYHYNCSSPPFDPCFDAFSLGNQD